MTGPPPDAPDMEILKISGLSLSLDGAQILRGVDLSVTRGGFLCVIGSNGSGKTSLLKCIAGIHRKYEGEILIAGRPADAPRAYRATPAADLARRVAYVPQSAPQDLPFTAKEFVEMARYPWRAFATRAEDESAVARAMEMTGVMSFADRRMDTLSGGERQKVLIAAAIAQDTEIMLLDEPTTYLDYGHQVETLELVTRINRERGVTVVAVTHDVNLALQAAGTVLALALGRVLWTGKPAELLEPGRLRGIYGVAFKQCYARGKSGQPFVTPAGMGEDE